MIHSCVRVSLTAVDSALRRRMREIVIEELADLHHVLTVDGTLNAVLVCVRVQEDAHLSGCRQWFGVVADSR